VVQHSKLEAAAVDGERGKKARTGVLISKQSSYKEQYISLAFQSI